MLNSSLWILRTSAPWRDLSNEYGSWQTVYKRVARWAQLLAWDKLLEKLEKSADSESISIDASYVKLHQHGTGAKGEHLAQAIGRSKGRLTTKTHAVVDVLGNPIWIKLTAGNVHDINPANAMITGYCSDYFLADRAYDTDPFSRILRI
jgi:transposase